MLWWGGAGLWGGLIGVRRLIRPSGYRSRDLPACETRPEVTRRGYDKLNFKILSQSEHSETISRRI